MSGLWTDLTVTELDAAGSRTVTTSLEPGVAEITGRRLLDRAAGVVAQFDEWSIEPGTIVPSLLTTNPDAQALLLGGALSRRPIAPIGPKLTVANIAFCVQNVGGAALLTEPEWEETARAAAAVAGVPVHVIDSLPAGGDLSALPPLGEEELVACLHTSGTTGLPKAVPMTNRQVGARTALLEAACGYDDTSVVAAASGFHHIAGLGVVLVAMGCGSTVVDLPRFTLAHWEQLRPLRPTHVALVSTFIEMLVAEGTFNIESLRCITYGASPIRVSTLRKVLGERPDISFIQWYGQTEGSPISWLSPDDHRRALIDGNDWLFETAGRAVPGVEIVIHEPDANSVGEIWARGAHLAIVDEDGWRHTGDLGSLDAEGYLRLAGRTGDMIIRGGENVYPAEVEGVLASHPKVANALVVGVPDPVLGERIKALIEPLEPTDPPEVEELRLFARERLAGFKVPVEWEFLRSFERNSTGKILRRAYRATDSTPADKAEA